MRSADIPFAEELLFTVKVPSDKPCFPKDKIISYRTSEGSLYLESGLQSEKDFTSLLVTILDEADVLDLLKQSAGKSLLRVDFSDENKHIMQLALLTYLEKTVLPDPLTIVVDDAIGPKLREMNIPANEAVRKFTNWFIYGKGNESVAFSIGNENVELVSKSWVLTIKQSSVSKYLHVVDIQRPRNRAEGLIRMICGNISFTDQKAVPDDVIRRDNEIYQKLITNNSELLKLWSAYNDCEKELAKKNRREMGTFAYSKWIEEGGRLVFFAKEGLVDGAFVQEDMYYEAISAADFSEEIFNEAGSSGAVIGTGPERSCVNTSRFVLVPEDFIDYGKIPSSGILFPSIRGSMVQAKRREIAQGRIRSGQCQIPRLKLLLQSGCVIGETLRHRAPVTDRLEKRMFGSSSGRHFNDRQKEAIDAAINTPDMAIIQGPPGTGKTQVIKSIIERISELEKGKARILITSTQHDAVDNAIGNISYNGVPVNRAVARKNESSSVSPIYDYVDHMIETCNSWLKNHEVKKKNYDDLFDAFEQLKTKCNPETVESLKNMLVKEEFPSKTVVELDSVARVCTDESGDLPDDMEALKRHIDNQSSEPEEFLNGGAENLRQLIGFIRNELGRPELVGNCWRKLARQTVPSDELEQQLKEFAQDLDKIRLDLGLDLGKDPDPELFDSLEKMLREEVAARIVRQEQSDFRSELVRDFMHELTSTTNVKNLIRTYSKINAATCQQSASRSISDTMKGFDDQYDYVIVDEAARSNPLDLMIPMVMGKKIILVGDQMQLPHMLEEDVVDQVLKQHENDPSIKTLLKESLFVRLFNSMKENDEKDSSAVRRVVMLNTQFRMHPMISGLVSRLFYMKEDGSGGLVSGCTAEDKQSFLTGYGNSALAWIDMCMEDGFSPESRGRSTRSRSRKCEVDELERRLAKILMMIPEAERIISEREGKPYKYTVGIITYYRDQMKKIDDLISSGFQDQADRIQVGTVDAFQGKEFDVVILSAVRSNKNREIGFLEDRNRMCVAFSRAKRLLIVIGDSGTVCASEPLKELYRICREGEGYYERLRAQR